MENIKNRIEELRKLLHYHSRKYYVEDSPEISDFEYDALYRELQVLEGDIPSPVNPPSGCKFHTRCKYCTEICEKVAPEWQEVRPDHFIACHHMLEQNL